MMPSRSRPNSDQIPSTESSTKNQSSTLYTYVQNPKEFVSPKRSSRDDDDSPPPAPPVRDSSSLKTIKYGPGHEKFPSWPVPAAAETPQALRGPPSGGSHRSKSWTDHTNYPKEKVVTYTRLFMKRQNPNYNNQQKLKTVMERCEKISPETFESRYDKMYLPHVDRDGKPLGDMDYMVPSPPERDITTKPQLTQADLEEYARSYQEPIKFNYVDSLKSHLTESGLEEYTRNYEESLFNSMNSKNDDDDGILTHLHQKQLSYAQSEGYHSYVSSTDSTSTPFLDRLRRDSEAIVTRSPNVTRCWDNLTHQQETSSNSTCEGRDSVVTTSSGSASSSETLKWHGSMSDVSVASSSCTHLANSINSSMSRQLIVHSARVQTPQRHHSESVLYMTADNQDGWKDRENKNNNVNKFKLFPVNTYTVQDYDHLNNNNSATSNNSNNSSRLPSANTTAPIQSVADRISELEKQQKYSYLDPNKKHKVPDPTLKAIQKKALLSFYERHHSTNGTSNNNKNSQWRSEPQLSQTKQILTTVPQPPPRVKLQLPSRRASSASDYASGANSKRSSLTIRESKTTENLNSNNNKTIPRHQHSNSCGSLSTDLLGPVIMGPSISVDDWIPEKPPERPPKNPHLRTAFPDLFQDQRIPSPDLPPPSPPTVLEDEVFNNDEPLPPPPPECETDWQKEFNERLKENTTSHHNIAEPQVAKNCTTAKSSKNEDKIDGKPPNSSPIKQTIGLPETSRYSGVRSSIKTRPADHIIQQVSSKPYPAGVALEKLKTEAKSTEQIIGFPNQRGYVERSSTRYPSTQKLVVNGGSIAVSQKVVNGISDQYRAEPLQKDNLKKLSNDIRKSQRASIAESPSKDVPPPLQPRQMRINQSMRAKLSTSDGGGGRMVMPISSKDGRVRESRSQSLSQSKASYLASRRDKDRIVPDSETGSYKRTMSPNGHAIPTATTTTPEVINEPQKINSRETIWPLNRPNKETIKNNNNNNIIRRSSMNEKPNKNKECDDKEDLKKANLVLPDVLPINAKMLNNRSQQYIPRPTNLSLIPQLDNDDSLNKSSPSKSPPSSPSKYIPRGSPFTPLRTTNLSNPPLLASFVQTSPISSPGNKLYTNSSPLSPKRVSPQVKPPLSPISPIRIPPVRSSSCSSSSTTSSSPLHISPLSSPQSSPKPALSSPDLSPPSSPKEPTVTTIDEECPKVIEGLQLIQRTEVILRVNTSTTDASSQTEKEELPPTPLPVRKKLQEEIECEKLSEDFVNHLPTSDRLKELLVPAPEHKKPTDYVQGLFRVEITSRPRPTNSPFRSRNSTPSTSPPPTLTTTLNSSSSTSSPNNSSSSSNSSSNTVVSSNKISSSPTATEFHVVTSKEPSSPLSGTSTYFTTSEPKAKFLTRYSQDMSQCHVVKDTKDLRQKKEELVSRLDRKLEVLRSEQLVVSEECKINNELGENVEAHISRLARPHEAAKFRLHIEEVGKITSLLLGLSGRLARAENALMGMSEEHPEKRILETKRDKLLDQLEEAKKLKECIDRRSVSVSNILYKYLNSEEYTDYDHFINMKAKLIMDSKEIADKIKLGEEQLMALKETLIVSSSD